MADIKKTKVYYLCTVNCAKVFIWGFVDSSCYFLYKMPFKNCKMKSSVKFFYKKARHKKSLFKIQEGHTSSCVVSIQVITLIYVSIPFKMYVGKKIKHVLLCGKEWLPWKVANKNSFQNRFPTLLFFPDEKSHEGNVLKKGAYLNFFKLF